MLLGQYWPRMECRGGSNDLGTIRVKTNPLVKGKIPRHEIWLLGLLTTSFALHWIGIYDLVTIKAQEKGELLPSAWHIAFFSHGQKASENSLDHSARQGTEEGKFRNGFHTSLEAFLSIHLGHTGNNLKYEGCTLHDQNFSGANFPESRSKRRKCWTKNSNSSSSRESDFPLLSSIPSYISPVYISVPPKTRIQKKVSC